MRGAPKFAIVSPGRLTANTYAIRTSGPTKVNEIANENPKKRMISLRRAE